jgi:hypothetical protein
MSNPTTKLEADRLKHLGLQAAMSSPILTGVDRKNSTSSSSVYFTPQPSSVTTPLASPREVQARVRPSGPRALPTTNSLMVELENLLATTEWAPFYRLAIRLLRGMTIEKKWTPKECEEILRVMARKIQDLREAKL